MSEFKSRALDAGDDLHAMLAVAEAVRSASAATPEQVAAASAVRRSLKSVFQQWSEMRVQVAEVRFKKLVAML